MQNSLIIDISNAHGGPSLRGSSHARLRVGHSYQSRGFLDGNLPARAPGLRSNFRVAAPGREGSDVWVKAPRRRFSPSGEQPPRTTNSRTGEHVDRAVQVTGTFLNRNRPPSLCSGPHLARLSRFGIESPAGDAGSFADKFRESLSTLHQSRPQIGRDHPLNLSILLSGGKETNQDSLSSGE